MECLRSTREAQTLFKYHIALGYGPRELVICTFLEAEESATLVCQLYVLFSLPHGSFLTLTTAPNKKVLICGVWKPNTLAWGLLCCIRPLFTLCKESPVREDVHYIGCGYSLQWLPFFFLDHRVLCEEAAWFLHFRPMGGGHGLWREKGGECLRWSYGLHWPSHQCLLTLGNLPW